MTAKTVHVKRSYLARIVQTYDITVDETLIPSDPDDVFAESDFDELVCTEGVLVEDHVELLDDDDLTIRLLGPAEPVTGNKFDPEMVEFRTTVGHLHGSPASDVTVEVYKLGGGTLGHEYEGDWGYRVSRLLDRQVLAQGEDYRTGTPHSHARVARDVAKLVDERCTRAA